LKLKELFQQIDEAKLVLPDFQRALEWKVDNQKELLSSFLVFLPIGNLLILKGSKNDFVAKKLCFPNQHIEPKEECLYLLDGQQRISSLKSIFSDFFRDYNSWRDTWENIYSNLRYRWFIRIKPNNNEEEDVFGWENLQFKGVKKCEPGLLVDKIEKEKIYKTKTDEWYNPGYYPIDKNGEPIMGENRRKNDIAKKAAERTFVPLYSIYESINSTQKPLHAYVLEKIAENRVDELKAEVEDGKRNIIELLQCVEDEIEYIVQNNQVDKILNAWSRLSARWSESILSYLNNLLDQEIPIIELPSDEISRAVSIFENINKGGTPLDTYDLIVAKAARNRNLESLTKRISKMLNNSITIPDSLWNGNYGIKPTEWYPKNMDTVDDNDISKFFKNQYLNLLSIYSYFDYGNIQNLKTEYIKRCKILDIEHDKINNNTEPVVKALIRACAFLQFRCGVINVKSIPYDLMVLPIAYVLLNDNYWNDKDIINKIEYWYWSALFGGAYREGQNEQCIKDIKELYLWITGNDNPFKNWFNHILNDPGYSDEKVLLMDDENHDIPSSIHTGILQYILSQQSTTKRFST